MSSDKIYFIKRANLQSERILIRMIKLSSIMSIFSNNTKYESPTIAIIGCGAITETFYLPAILKNKHVSNKLILVDSNEARLKQLSDKYNIQNVKTSYQDILGKVDGVIIAVPHHLHYKMSMDFLKHGAHVLCEKPLAVSFKEATEMVEQSVASNVTLSVNNTRRLFPSYRKIKDLIQNGSIGNLISIEYSNGFLFQWPTASGFYFNYKEGPPKGVLLDQGAHVLDLICWWMGNKPDVINSQNDSFGGCEGMAVVALKGGSCTVDVRLSWLSQLQNTFKIVGEEGTIEGGIEDWNYIKVKLRNGKDKIINTKCKEISYVDFGDKLVTNFIDVVRDIGIPLIPAIEVIPSIKLIEECYEVRTKLSTPWYDDLEALNGK